MRRTPTAEEKRYLRELFPDRPDSPCIDCGGWHWRACPRIRRQVWLGQGPGEGNRIEVEYWEHWDDSEVIWPEEIFDDDLDDENELPSQSGR